LAATGSNVTSLEALIRPADQELRIDVSAHDSLLFTVGHRGVITARPDTTLVGTSDALLQEEEEA